MILKVGKETSEAELIVNMWLVECGDTIEVRAESTNHCGEFTIMVFRPDGRFYRVGCVPANLGFVVSTPKGAIVES